MVRVAAVLVVFVFLLGCGSEQETLAAPESKPAESASYDHCASRLAVGSNGAEMTEEARQALKEARAALADQAVLCASKVDRSNSGGWTPYAPLPDESP